MTELWSGPLGKDARETRLSEITGFPNAIVLNSNWVVVGVTQAGARFMARHLRHGGLKIGDNFRDICERTGGPACQLMLDGMASIDRGQEEFVGSLPDEAGDGALDVAMTALWAHSGRHILLRGNEMPMRNPTVVPIRDLAAPLRADDVRRRERERIARELHDGIAQWLVGMRLELAALRTLDNKDRVVELADEMTSHIEHLQQDVRALIRQLHPPQLDRLGLHDAIRSLCAEHARYRGAKVELSIYGPDRQHARELESTAFRIVQEALTNAQKHASARCIRVRLSVRPDALAVSVADDGVGLSARLHSLDDREPPGLGVVGMMARVDAVGGRIAIHNRKLSQGTIVIAILPLLTEVSLAKAEIAAV